MNKLKLMIMPTYSSARESLGYEEFGGGNPDDVLFQQGYDAEVIEVANNRIFTIPDGHIGRIMDAESEMFLIIDIEDLKDKYLYENIIEEDLEEGKYQFLANHNAIMMLE